MFNCTDYLEPGGEEAVDKENVSPGEKKIRQK